MVYSPVERVIKYIDCEAISGRALCDSIIHLLPMLIKILKSVKLRHDGATMASHLKVLLLFLREGFPGLLTICVPIMV